MQDPILKVRDVLIASIQAVLSDDDLNGLRDTLADRIGSVRARGVVIDVGALDVLDSFASRTLQSIAYPARLRGAATVVVGIQPDVAMAMVQLGLTLGDIPTAVDMEEGIELLEQRSRAGGRHAH